MQNFQNSTIIGTRRSATRGIFMQTLSASEIKRRGIAAVEEYLPHGPVHIIKNNHLAYVVMSEHAYQELKRSARKRAKLTLSALLKKPATGKATRKDLDKQIKQERDEWDK